MHKSVSITVVFLLLLLTFVSAVTISGATTYEGCQCQTQKQVYSVCAQTAGTYTVQVEGSSAKWFSVAPESVTLGAGECTSVFVFLTPECYATASLYPATLTVSGPEKQSLNLSVNVQQCHTVDYAVTPTTNTANPCQSSTYNVHVQNTGKFTDDFVLTAKGLNDSWLTFPRSSIILKAGEALDTQVVVTPACTAKAGNYPFTLTLSNTLTNVTKSLALMQNVAQITPFETTFSTSASDINSCSETGRDYNFYVKNISPVDDTYTLSTSHSDILSLSTSTLSLKSGESTQVTMHIAAVAIQEVAPVLHIYSQKYDTNYAQSFNLNISDCQNVFLERLTKDTKSCFESSDELFRLHNYGTQVITAHIAITGIDANGTDVNVAAGASRDFYLHFDPKTLGTKNVHVTATTQFASSALDFNFDVLNCYDVTVTMPSITTCPGAIVHDKVILKNNGVVDQTVNLNSYETSWISFDSIKVAVPAGKTVEVPFTAVVPGAVAPSYTLTAVAYSQGLGSDFVKAVLREQDINAPFSFTLKDANECYAFTAQYTTQSLDINCCQGKVVDLNITNTGYFTQIIDLNKIAPEWVDFSDTNITVESGKSKTVYVYFHPPAGTNQKVTSTIELKNQAGVVHTVTFDLNVFGGFCGAAYTINVSIGSTVPNAQDVNTTQVAVNFLVTNDSNYSFTLKNVSIPDYNSKADFNTAVLLEPGQSMQVTLQVSKPAGTVLEDKNVPILVETSIGNRTEYQVVHFSDADPQKLSISGFFGSYAAPIAGLVVLFIVLVAALLFISKAKK